MGPRLRTAIVAGVVALMFLVGGGAVVAALVPQNSSFPAGIEPIEVPAPDATVDPNPESSSPAPTPTSATPSTVPPAPQPVAPQTPVDVNDDDDGDDDELDD